MANSKGFPTLSPTLIRPTTTTTPEPPEPAEAGATAETGQGGEAESPRPRASRRVRRDRGQDVIKGRKLHLPDAVFERLQLVAIQRRTTVSAVAADLLDRNLPRLRIEREG